MQRRTLLLVTMFVVTAWFYASVADDSAAEVVDNHQKQAQALEQVEEMLSSNADTAEKPDSG